MNTKTDEHDENKENHNVLLLLIFHDGVVVYLEEG